jgi:chromosome segregation ATPase
MQQRLLQASPKKQVNHRHIHQVSTPNLNVACIASNSVLDKRKRKREQSVSDDEIYDSRKDLEDRLARMEACLAETQTHLAKMEARVAELEANREEKEEEGTDRGGYGEEEVANQVSELLDDFIYSDKLENMVEDLVGKYMGHLNIDVDDMFAQKENRFDETIEEVKQDVMKDCREIVLEQVKRHLTELIDTRLEFSFNKKES